MPNSQPPQAIVRERLSYDPESGEFRWLRPENVCFLGKEAGAFDKTSGYMRLKLSPFGAFGAHRIAWIHFHGNYDDDAFCIDHIDGNRVNNAIKNLRLATFSQNQMNSKPRSKTGVKGVEILANGRYRARIYPFGPGGGKIDLGCYASLDDAARARREASLKYFGSFSREV